MSRQIRGRDRDQGSVLILVLVLLVIGSLIVVPLLDYALSVSTHNSVLSNKTKRQEAVKAGLRTALADPVKLYTHCGETGGDLAGPGIDGVPVSTDCDFIDYSLAEADEDLHLGLVATRVGESIPAGMEAIVQKDADGDVLLDGSGNPLRYVYAPLTTDPNEWLDTAATYATFPVSSPRRIWLPNLPAHSLNIRSSTGYQMPAGYPTCTVYFPGTYPDPLTLTGPTYFASGIYYFQNVVTVAAGGDVVVGMGQNEGCTNDQEAAFYAVNAPATHNISGLGGTFIFGRSATRDTDAKLVVTNAAGTPKLRFNQRYVNDSDIGGLPSFGVSIISVNGKATSAPDGNGRVTLADLDVVGVNKVPFSLVGVHDGEVAPVSAGTDRLEPSTLTHEPRPPTPPLWPASGTYVIPLRTGSGTTDGAVRVIFEEPENMGGMPVVEYVVTANPGGRQCIPTTMPLECIITGLTHNQAYTFTVTARNDIGTSVPSAASPTVTPRTSSTPSPLVAIPATPAAPTVVRYSDDTVQVSWTAPADNNSPIAAYHVTATPAIDPETHPCVMISATSCIIRNLPTYDPDDLLDLFDLFSDYTFTVNAENEMGNSLDSPSSLTGLLIPPALGASPADPAPEPPVVVAPYEPPPIVDIDLSTANPAVIDIPGYVSVPMGVFRINNPNGLGSGDSKVAITGGVLAAAFRIEDDREVAGELTIPIGLVNPIIQRTFKITSFTTSGSPRVTSTAIVQVNQNGAYAVNSWSVQ